MEEPQHDGEAIGTGRIRSCEETVRDDIGKGVDSHLNGGHLGASRADPVQLKRVGVVN